MPYLSYYASMQAQTPLAYWTYPSEAMVFCCNRLEGYGGSTAAYSYVSYRATHWSGTDTGHVGIAHNNGSNVAFLDGHAKWVGISQFMRTDSVGRRLWGHEH